MLVHNKMPTYTCKLCSLGLPTSQDLWKHLHQVHGISDDFMDALSVESDDGGQEPDDDGDASRADTVGHQNGKDKELENRFKHSLPGGAGGGTGQPGFHGNRDCDSGVNSDVKRTKEASGETSDQKLYPGVIDAMPKLDANVTIVTNHPEQVTVS